MRVSLGDPLCKYVCVCNLGLGVPHWESLSEDPAWIRTKTGCVLKTEVLLHIVITLPTPHAQESLHAREARDPAEPRWIWAPVAPSP